jgi:hypothetical protein
MADTSSHVPCHSHAMLCRGLEKWLSERHGCGMPRVNQTRLHCVNQMGKTQSKPLVAVAGTQDRRLEPGRSHRIFWVEKIHGMPSFGGEVKLSVLCRSFAACKKSVIYVKSESQAKLTSHFSPVIRPSLIEASHVAWRGAPLEMTGRTKGGAKRACSV